MALHHVLWIFEESSHVILLLVCLAFGYLWLLEKNKASRPLNQSSPSPAKHNGVAAGPALPSAPLNWESAWADTDGGQTSLYGGSRKPRRRPLPAEMYDLLADAARAAQTAGPPSPAREALRPPSLTAERLSTLSSVTSVVLDPLHALATTATFEAPSPSLTRHAAPHPTAGSPGDGALAATLRSLSPQLRREAPTVVRHRLQGDAIGPTSAQSPPSLLSRMESGPAPTSSPHRNETVALRLGPLPAAAGTPSQLVWAAPSPSDPRPAAASGGADVAPFRRVIRLTDAPAPPAASAPGTAGSVPYTVQRSVSPAVRRIPSQHVVVHNGAPPSASYGPDAERPVRIATALANGPQDSGPPKILAVTRVPSATFIQQSHQEPPRVVSASTPSSGTAVEANHGKMTMDLPPSYATAIQHAAVVPSAARDSQPAPAPGGQSVTHPSPAPRVLKTLVGYERGDHAALRVPLRVPVGHAAGSPFPVTTQASS